MPLKNKDETSGHHTRRNIVHMMDIYDEWNLLLLNEYFNEANCDESVWIQTSREELNSFGFRYGGVDGLIEAIKLSICFVRLKIILHIKKFYKNAILNVLSFLLKSINKYILHVYTFLTVICFVFHWN